MTRTLSITLIGLLCCGPTALAADDGQPRCSDRSLLGIYIYSIVGRDALPSDGGTGGPYAEAGQDVFDGQGMVTTTYSSSHEQEQVIRGRYSLDPDCTGKVTYSLDGGTQKVHRIFVDPLGTRLSFIDTTDTTEGYILGGEKIRVTPRDSALAHCSTRLLQGTYSYSIHGAVTTPAGLRLFREAGLESFDGKGGIVNRFVDNLGNEATITGTYEIAPNCIGTASYASGGVYRIYLDPVGRHFAFVDLTAGAERSGLNTRISRGSIVKAPESE
ncbi:MAG: hypothetical protein EOM91_16355 [Sphingobacteriia bacterium]|nr:hypothetical protein [Sphingobacteriia bacterium]NCC41322.1 hypothetical protein [Gammaproteobacteria bacterium]